jgi:predicted DNA-binding transcriptional regulator AlpA
LAGESRDIRVGGASAPIKPKGPNTMTTQVAPAGGASPQKLSASTIILLRPKEAAKLLKVSTSWLAKARMRGDGPPYIPVGRAIRYSEAALLQWMKSRQRLSTSDR